MAKRQRNYSYNSEWEDQYCFIECKYNIFLIKRLATVKFSSVIIFINIIILLLLLQSPHGARASTAISQMCPDI
jgi:hypothetical protein